MNQPIIPDHIQIEIVTGYCTSRCTFCTIDNWHRPKNIMTTEFFSKLLLRFENIKSHIKFLTLLGFGETLLDREIDRKITFAKEQGFRGVGFATNATELDEDCSTRLIRAGLDTLIISIDGISKKTHESIRVGTDFNKICTNTKNFIRIRDELQGKTRVLIRFVRTPENYDEWPEFRKYWLNYVDLDKKDDVIMHDVHNWGKSKRKNQLKSAENISCPDLFSKITVFSDGHMALCCADDNGLLNLDNVMDKDPIEIYNNETFNRYRELMRTGRISELNPCCNCTIIDSRSNKVKPRFIEADN